MTFIDLQVACRREMPGNAVTASAILNDIIGSEPIAKAIPDGCTLLNVSNSTLAGNAAPYKEKLPYSPSKDFAPIINFITTLQMLF